MMPLMTLGLTIASAPGARPGEDPWGPVFAIEEPVSVVAPVVFASPHSGRRYPDVFLDACRAPLADLRRIEDAYVDRLLADVHTCGAPLIHGLIGRACIDLNRAETEIDPDMFSDAGTMYAAAARTPRVAAGLGCIPRVAHNGAAIYGRKLAKADAEARFRAVYRPYHRALEALLRRGEAMFGRCWLIDVHSMPDDGPAPARDRNASGPALRAEASGADIVIGDRFGAACGGEFADHIETLFRRRGYTTARNKPYAGGFATVHYGRPALGREAVQIEVRRRLYLDEDAVEPHEGFFALKECLTEIAGEICAFACDRVLGERQDKKKAASDADAAKVLGRKRP
ncbi:N-formylglutamate amidohydrolase [bacterium]|nr:N-formylglutamate amidohydrolase [bacterium]